MATKARGTPLSAKDVAQIGPDDVHNVLGRVMLADGMQLVVDHRRDGKSHGNHLYDLKTDSTYIDFFSYFASWAVGHNHPKMKDPAFLEKIHRASTVNPTNSDIYCVEMAQFVATFERVLMPPVMKYVFFVAGGALAVENALKAAFDWKVRKNLAANKGEKGSKIVHFRSAFHGRSGYTMSLTNTDPNKIMYFPQFDWPRVDLPSITFPLEGQNLKDVIEAEKRAVEQLNQIFKKDADDIAAIIIEPIQGEGGDRHYRAEFLRELRGFADKYDCMLIYDEVQAGVGLTGKMWAYQHLGVVPDMISFGKKTQVCGFMCGARIDEVAENVFHKPGRLNSTWGANLVDMVRAQRIYEIIEEDNLVENAARVGEYLLKELLKLQAKYHKFISNARGRGLMCAFDMPSVDIRKKFLASLYAKKLIMLPCGVTTVRVRPALITTTEDIDQAIAIMDEVLKEQ